MKRRKKNERKKERKKEDEVSDASWSKTSCEQIRLGEQMIISYGF